MIAYFELYGITGTPVGCTTQNVQASEAEHSQMEDYVKDQWNQQPNLSKDQIAYCCSYKRSNIQKYRSIKGYRFVQGFEFRKYQIKLI